MVRGKQEVSFVLDSPLGLNALLPVLRNGGREFSMRILVVSPVPEGSLYLERAYEFPKNAEIERYTGDDLQCKTFFQQECDIAFIGAPSCIRGLAAAQRALTAIPKDKPAVIICYKEEDSKLLGTLLDTKDARIDLVITLEKPKVVERLPLLHPHLVDRVYSCNKNGRNTVSLPDLTETVLSQMKLFQMISQHTR